MAWLGDFEGHLRTAQGLGSSPVIAMRVFSWTMRSYLESSNSDDARRHLARAQAELGGRRDAGSDLNLDLVAGIMAEIPAVLAAYEGDPASALRHARQALDIEARTITTLCFWCRPRSSSGVRDRAG